MYKNRFYLLTILLSFVFSDEGRICGTTAPSHEIIESIQLYNENKFNQFPQNRELYWVPVQFHIVQHSNGSGGLNEIILPGIIDDLNMDYINAYIRFYQYSEVDFILNSDFYEIESDAEINDLRSINNVENVIDIYAVPDLSSDNGSICGKSSFTWYGIQGIVVDNSCFDRFTVNHEVGHYFDLFHPHEDASGEEFVNGSGCTVRGDGLCDTPADPKLNEDGMVNACMYTGTATDPNGQEYDDCQGYPPCELYGGPDIGNIMSYAPDNCVNHFTDEQYEKVEFILHSLRPNYIISPDYVEYNIEVHSIEDVNGDNDSVINPGEEINLFLNINIDESWPVGANEIIITLTTNEENVNIVYNQLYLPNLSNGESFINEDEPFQIQFSSYAEMKDYEFKLNIAYLSENDNYNEMNFDFSLNVSLNQYGFPFEANSTIKSSPAIVDLDGDGDSEIIFGSHSGILYICENSMEDCSEFVTNGQIWGSPAIADIDNDGNLEIIFGSVDKYIYVLNHFGELEYSYFTNQFLVGTPALGNLDLDSELEIVIGGFTTNSKLFAFNHDLTELVNFPIDINEKIKEGVALADVDNDGVDEMFFGTESYNFYRINHEGVIFNNSPIFTVNDKIVFAPVIIKHQNDFSIGFGSDDGDFYLINSDGNLEFSYSTGNKIRSSASIIDIDNEIYILFGSEDGFLYLVDINGNDKLNWPVFIGESIENAPIFLDLHNDDSVEIIVVGSNRVEFLNVNGEFIENPIEYNYSITSSPIVYDLDLDGDLELIVGTNYDLLGIDVKTPGNNQNLWSMFRGNLKRNGFVDYSELKNEPYVVIEEFELINPFPNPFNNMVNIPLTIDKPGEYILNIFNIKGEQVFTNKKHFDIIGRNQFYVNLEDASSGAYLIQLENNKSVKTSKIILLK